MVSRIGALSVRDLENLFVPVLRNCANMVELRKIQANIVKYSLTQSNFLVTKMVCVCDKKGDIDHASLLFKMVVEPNIYLYNAMIRAYTHNHMHLLSITIYKQMLRHPHGENPICPDKFTFPFVIKSCAGLMCCDLGKQVHAHVCKFGPVSNPVLENSLIDMYTKCDNLVHAHRVFEEMSERDVLSWTSIISGYVRLGQMTRAKAMFEEMPDKTVISWTAMISGYARIGCYADALDVFQRMQMVGVKPDEISVTAILSACAQLGAHELGKWIHIYAEKNQFLGKTCVCNALIELYAKCGSIDEALRLFSQMLDRDVISWSTMISALANHGRACEAIELFQEMQTTKVEPNGITFVGIFSACAHAGFLNEGLMYFDLMTKVYHIKPEIEHYGCLVDLLARCGCLDRALELIQEMPMKPDSKIWGSLLSSSRTHCNLAVAVTAMEHLLELEPDDTGNYILLSNLYANLGRWEGVLRMRKLIRSKSMKKTPGCSMIEINNVIQEFVSGDSSKPFSEDIFSMLDLLAFHQSNTDYMFQIMQEDTSLCCF